MRIYSEAPNIRISSELVGGFSPGLFETTSTKLGLAGRSAMLAGSNALPRTVLPFWTRLIHMDAAV
jgi:hypothetical protein